MAGSIQPNEISSEGALRRRDARPLHLEASAKTGLAVGGFSSQLEGLMEAATLDVQAKSTTFTSTTKSDAESPRAESAAEDSDAESVEEREPTLNNEAKGRPVDDDDQEPEVADATLPSHNLIAAAPQAAQAKPSASANAELPSAAAGADLAQGADFEADADANATLSQDADSAEQLPEAPLENADAADALEGADADGLTDLASDGEVIADADPEPLPVSAKPQAAKADDRAKTDTPLVAEASDAAPEAAESAMAATDADESQPEADAPAELGAEEASTDDTDPEAPEADAASDELRIERLARHAEARDLDQPDAQDADLNLDADLQNPDDASLETRNSLPPSPTQNIDAVISQVAAASLVSARANAPVATASAAEGAAAAASASASANAAIGEGQDSNANSGDGGNAKSNETAQRARSSKPVRFSKAMQSRQIEVVRQISKAISLRAATRADGRMNLLLSPEALGTISLEMSFDDKGALRIDGATHSDATRHLLAGSAEDLRQALRQENIDLARFVLTDGRSGQSGDGGKSAEESRGGKSGSNARRSLRGVAGLTGPAPEEVKDASRASGSVALGAVDLQA